MKIFLAISAIVGALAVVYNLLFSFDSYGASPHPESDANLIKLHSEIYKQPRLIQVTDRIYVAVGYALANMILIIGPTGNIVVDTTESEEISTLVYKQFYKISPQPLKAIILTHFHADHVMGARDIIDMCSQNHEKVEVITHSSFSKEMEKFKSTFKVAYRRAGRQFGFFLNPSEHIDSGIGRLLALSPSSRFRMAEASQTFDTEKQYYIAGVKFTLFHTPGETNDQITVWIPEWKVVMPADNIYESFPNLYAIRGSPPRDCKHWYQSLDKVRRLGAEYMVPSHTLPVAGKENIFDIITHYRDAIQFVHDQTIRWMNHGLEVDEIVEKVRLPPSLAKHPYLQPFYGNVSWSVRGVFSNQLGWFDGDPVNLNPLSKKQRAKNIVELLNQKPGPSVVRKSREISSEKLKRPHSERQKASALKGSKRTDKSGKSAMEKPKASGKVSPGVEKMLSKSKTCIDKSAEEFEANSRVFTDELQWGLELASTVFKASEAGTAEYAKAKELMINALKLYGQSTINLNAKNYYLTYANELEQKIIVEIPKQTRIKMIESSNPKELLGEIRRRLKAENCDDRKLLVFVFEFTDTKETFGYILRHCILEFISRADLIPTAYDVKLRVSSAVWKDIVSAKKSAVSAYSSSELAVKGNVLYFKYFIDLIDKS